MSQSYMDFDLQVVRKYYDLVFSRSSGIVAAKNRKILKTFGNLIADEAPQVYSTIIGKLIDRWEIIRYYEEHWPIVVSIVVLGEKNSEFFYSQEDYKMQILFEKFLDILQHSNNHEITPDTAELAVARFWSYFGVSKIKSSTKKVSNAKERTNRVKEKSDTRNMRKIHRSQNAENIRPKTKRVSKKAQKIAQIDSFINGIDEHKRNPNLAKFVMLLEDIVSFLEHEADRIKKTYEYVRNKNKAQKLVRE